jgi:hypothetical protein
LGGLIIEIHDLFQFAFYGLFQSHDLGLTG